MNRVVFFIFFSLISTGLFAQIGGSSSLQFLTLAPSARQEALGGYLVPFNDADLSMTYQNPASIKPSMHRFLSISSVLYPGGVKHGLVSYARNLDSLDATLSYGVQFINYGSDHRTDETGRIDGKWYANEFAYYLGFGRKWNDLRYGANVKLISSFFEVYSAYAFAIDVSVIYEKNDFVATFATKNVGFMFKSYVKGNRESLPLNVEFGVSNQLEHLPLRVFATAHNMQQFNIRYKQSGEDSVASSWLNSDTASNNSTKLYTVDKLMRHFVFGGELSIGKNLKFRLAYNYLRRQEMKLVDKSGTVGFSWGLGVNIKKFQVAYSRSNYHYAGTPNNLTINFKMRSKVEKGKSIKSEKSEVKKKKVKVKDQSKGDHIK